MNLQFVENRSKYMIFQDCLYFVSDHYRESRGIGITGTNDLA